MKSTVAIWPAVSVRSSERAVHILRVFSSWPVSKRLRETSSLLIAKREAAELEVYNEIVRDYANSIASIKAVVAATEEQIAACEAEMGAIDGQVSAASASFAHKQTAMSVAAERCTSSHTRALTPRHTACMNSAALFAVLKLVTAIAPLAMRWISTAL